MLVYGSEPAAARTAVSSDAGPGRRGHDGAGSVKVTGSLYVIGPRGGAPSPGVPFPAAVPGVAAGADPRPLHHHALFHHDGRR